MFSILVVFLSTPQAILHNLSVVSSVKENDPIFQWLPQWLPNEMYTLSVFGLGRAIQQLCCYAVIWLGYHVESQTNFWMLCYATTYLILIVLILPTLNVNEAWRYIRDLVLSKGELSSAKYSLECFFHPRGVLIFIQYLLSAAVVGSAFEMIRFTDMILFLWTCVTSTTWAELIAYFRSSERISVWFGDYYSFDLLNLAITMGLSTTCPIIVPFGLLYFIMKHIVSSYTLRNAYAPTQIGVNFHRALVSYVVGTAVLCQVYTAAFVHIYASEKGSYAASTAGVIAALSVTLWIVEVDSAWRWPVPVFPWDFEKVAVQKQKVGGCFIPSYAGPAFADIIGQRIDDLDKTELTRVSTGPSLPSYITRCAISSATWNH